MLSRKPAIYLESDDYCRSVTFEGKSITKSLFADIDSCAEFTKVTIPENVEGVRGDAFEEFANLQEAEIFGLLSARCLYMLRRRCERASKNFLV